MPYRGTGVGVTRPEFGSLGRWFGPVVGCFALLWLVPGFDEHPLLAPPAPSNALTADLPRVSAVMTQEELDGRERSRYVVPEDTTLQEIVRRWDRQVRVVDLCNDPENLRLVGEDCAPGSSVAAGSTLMLPLRRQPTDALARGPR